MSIATSCMIANLSISVFEGHRLDKDASHTLTTGAKAEADAARVNKHLVPKESLKAISQTVSALRTHFYTHTLPWKDNGDRVLPRAMYFQFMQELGVLKAQFDAAVAAFLQEWPSIVAKAQFRMGSLFKAEDYPSVQQLQRRFKVDVSIEPIAEAGDFRVLMDAEEVDRIREQMTEQLSERLSRAMLDVWQRLAKVLGYFAERMADEKAIFRDTTVTNLQELVALLPGLNIANDPQLAEIHDDLTRLVTGLDPDAIRKDPLTRRVVCEKAQGIMDQMAGFMNAFKGAA